MLRYNDGISVQSSRASTTTLRYNFGSCAASRFCVATTPAPRLYNGSSVPVVSCYNCTTPMFHLSDGSSVRSPRASTPTPFSQRRQQRPRRLVV
ncbi:hypothetical protein SDRG_15561 [Saprolegnia diclina VS20]|uniref:Uncharacterized protein n=1 Tax=Saprolegnia diclina (strain VS20) TaxID=1156394 RepID=T0PWL1_SAPDV|nr:hypothetical protein SDRG_15561 [Saprolegnia diclina VS20]EQC26621.1 hypothetical protein SDRG_15561 [Saprolegnia diclina VS20]|eukprot:XP_008619959.1 hypothetical protein SDRG_15561 [Saprolegnia diclina VS20]